MEERLRTVAAETRTLVRRFLGLGRSARLLAGLAIALAAIVWLGLVLLVLRFLLAAVLLGATVAVVGLIVAVWRWQPSGGEQPLSPALRRLLSRARPSFVAAAPQTWCAADGSRQVVAEGEQETLSDLLAPHLAKREAALAALRRSLDALHVDLSARQDRLAAETERQYQEMATQIEATHALVARFECVLSAAGAERAMPRPSRGHRQAAVSVRGAAAPTDTGPALRAANDEPPADLHLAAVQELEADLRLEQIEQREQRLREREQRLNRRERELANFVAQTQQQLAG